MSEIGKSEDTFIAKLSAIVEEHMSDEKFGVSELAAKAHMSRSNLLRKIQKATGSSASVFIRGIRLSRAKQLLREKESNVSEIAYSVGFNSVSYFIKCFREQYGYTPGEENLQPLFEESTKATKFSFK